MRSMQWQLGMLGTVSAFAYSTGKPRKTCVDVAGSRTFRAHVTSLEICSHCHLNCVHPHCYWNYALQCHLNYVRKPSRWNYVHSHLNYGHVHCYWNQAHTLSLIYIFIPNLFLEDKIHLPVDLLILVSSRFKISFQLPQIQVLVVFLSPLQTNH